MPEVIIVPVIFLSIVAVIRMGLSHREKMAGRNLSSSADTRAIEERLTRMEQSIEAIAIEMERVGEGQRFVTRLLSDRSPALPVGSGKSEHMS